VVLLREKQDSPADSSGVTDAAYSGSSA